MNFSEGTAKFCITLLPDEESLKQIRKLAQHLEQTFPELFSSSEQPGAIPYHVTVIGGIHLPHSMHKQRIEEAITKLKVFNNEHVAPIIHDIEPLQMNGNNIAIRLKFKAGTYTLTGDREENQRLVNNLGSIFSLDSIRHITVGHVMGAFKEMDLVYPEFSKILHPEREKLCSMTFTPCVWMKSEETCGNWVEYKP